MDTQTKNCQNCKQSFIIEPEDFLFYEKMQVPPPTWCPECRIKRRLHWRNERTLWKREANNSGKQVVSMIPPGQFKVYEREYWWSDNWDGTEYGKDYDFSRPFLEQVGELVKEVPWCDLLNVNVVNCQYCHDTLDLKNSYLSFDAGYGEHLYYGTGTHHSNYCFDVTACTYCERSAESFDCHNSYNVFYSSGCRNCSQVYFSKDCTGCSNCFGCIGLRNKSYYIFNKPYTKEDYFEELKKYNLGSARQVEVIKNKAKEFWLQHPVKFMHGTNNVNVIGDFVDHSKNVKNVFWANGAEDCRFMLSCYWPPNKDEYDVCVTGDGAELLYEVMGCGVQSSNIKFSTIIWPACHQVTYSINCINVSNCFGCVGLRNKQYCILNKQYSKEEYERLVPQIIRHMNEMPYVDGQARVYKYGEFFPPEFSPFSYNESVAREYFPLTKEEVKALGFWWRDQDEKNYSITLGGSTIPDNVEDADESMYKESIECKHRGTCNEQCTIAFRIIPQELAFYKESNLALPRLCPNCRHGERLKERNLFKFYKRRCDCAGPRSSKGTYQNQSEHFHGSEHCPNEFETTYAPEQPNIVYCEPCYQAEVV